MALFIMMLNHLSFVELRLGSGVLFCWLLCLLLGGIGERFTRKERGKEEHVNKMKGEEET